MKKEKNITYQIAILAFLFVISTVMVTSAPFQMLSDVNSNFASNFSFKLANAADDDSNGDNKSDQDFAQEAEVEEEDQESNQDFAQEAEVEEEDQESNQDFAQEAEVEEEDQESNQDFAQEAEVEDVDQESDQEAEVEDVDQESDQESD